MKADPIIIRAWVDALRSGDYQQGRGNLRLENKFCCLGVLCDLHAEAFGYKWNRDRTEYLGEDSYLPTEVYEWAGLREANPQVTTDPPYTHKDQLSDLNDGQIYITLSNGKKAGERYTFNEIADIIEKEWLT